ncbi:unnamed protein product, partial [Prorocentrum cordatum]
FSARVQRPTERLRRDPPAVLRNRPCPCDIQAGAGTSGCTTQGPKTTSRWFDPAFDGSTLLSYSARRPRRDRACRATGAENCNWCRPSDAMFSTDAPSSRHHTHGMCRVTQAAKHSRNTKPLPNEKGSCFRTPIVRGSRSVWISGPSAGPRHVVAAAQGRRAAWRPGGRRWRRGHRQRSAGRYLDPKAARARALPRSIGHLAPPVSRPRRDIASRPFSRMAS